MHPLLATLLETDRRCRLRNDRPLDAAGQCVLLWMQRAQRGVDNPAFDVAIDLANALALPLFVFLAPVPFFPHANERHYAFLLDGVADVERDVTRRGAAFVYRPFPNHRLDRFASEVKPAIVIGDENPLRETERWRVVAAERLDVALVTVDADVVVPTACFEKEEFAARTIRPKIHKRLGDFLVDPPARRAHVRAESPPKSESITKEKLLARLPIDRKAAPVAAFTGGTRAGLAELRSFVTRRLAHYPERRNRPEDEAGTSRLSPWLHFGHIGPRQVARAVIDSNAPDAAKEAFIEQLVVRRELAINYVARNPDYDRLAGQAAWALKTLALHAGDPRPHRYTREQLELGKTNDPLWNAAQHEMRVTGHMHNVMRMYWGKKLLEWSKTPDDAFAIAIELNDRYELDGRDPNGYTGIAWSIAGKHDRPWAPQRPVFGMVRCMTFASTSRKFDWKAYAARVLAAARQCGDMPAIDALESRESREPREDRSR